MFKILIRTFSIFLLFFLNIVQFNLNAQIIKTDTISKQKSTKIVQLLKLSGTSDFSYLVIDNVMTNYKNMMKNVPDLVWDTLKTDVDITPFVYSLIPIYDKRFTEDEIDYLIAFFISPVGRKWSTYLAAMNEEVMTNADKFSQDVYMILNKELMKRGYINEQK